MKEKVVKGPNCGLNINYYIAGATYSTAIATYGHGDL